MREFIFFIIIYMYIYGHISLGGAKIFQFQIILGVISSIYYFYKILVRNKIVFSKEYFKIVYLSIFISLLYFISVLLNNISLNSNPMSEYLIRTLVNIFTSFFIVEFFKIKSYKKILKVVTFVIVVDLVIALLRFYIEPFSNILNLIFLPDDRIFRYYIEYKTRLIGLGGYFFNGGVQLSIGLICIAYLIEKEKSKIKYKVLFCITLIIGTFEAGTTMIGGILGIFYLLKKEVIKKLKIFFFMISSMMLLLFFYFSKIIFYSSKKNFFLEYFSTKLVSVEEMLTMYKISFDPKTIFIGDGIWNLKDGSYYMNTDIGYLRIFYCIGIFGICFFLLINLSIYLFFKKNKEKEIEKLSLYLLILTLILNLKGYVDIPKLSYLIFTLGIKKYLLKENKYGN